MQILAGFDGYHRHGCWLPLKITLTTSGGSVSGEIVSDVYMSDTDSRQTYSRPVEVFDIARNLEYLYVFPETYRRNLSISFVDENDREILQREVSLKNLSQDERLMVVVADVGGGLEFLAGGRNVISYVTTELLPDSWMGFDSVDVMVLGDVSPNSFSDDQRQAVVDWVYSGGVLIVSGGVYSQALMGTFVEKILPVRVNGIRVLNSAGSLSQRYGGNIGEGRFVIASSELANEGRIIVAEGDGPPVIAERQVGYGKTVFLAFDCLDPAIRSWGGKKRMWEEILPEPVIRAYPEDKEISRILLATGYKGPLSYKWAGLFLLLYVLCLAPLNYYALKRIGRTTLIWLSMPAISLIFVVVALGFNHNVKGRAVIINDLSVVDFYQELGRARVTSYFGLFSPANRDYLLRFPEIKDVFLRSVQSKDKKIDQARDYKLLENETYGMRISKARALSPALLRGESYINLDGNVSIELDEDFGGIVNSKLSFDLMECYAFSNGYYAYIGDLKRDATVDISTSGDVPGTQSKMGGEKQRFFNSIRQRLSGNIAGAGLVGWADESSLRKFLGMNMDVEYNTVGAMLVIIHGDGLRSIE